MMKKQILIIGFILVSMAITGCGTTSGLKVDSPAQASTTKSVKKPLPLLASYDRVVVNDIKDNEESALTDAGKRFADRIALEIKKTGAFSTVSRKPLEGHAVVIDGEITLYDDGNATARLLIGLGAGSSRLDAIIVGTDNETGKKFGEIIVDKNSWFLGGGIAMTQDADSHMQPAAQKIASELKAAKTGEKTSSN